MFCKFCGTQINDDDLFCPNCGQKRTNVASSANATGTRTTQQQQQTANATQTAQAQITPAAPKTEIDKKVFMFMAIGAAIGLINYLVSIKTDYSGLFSTFYFFSPIVYVVICMIINKYDFKSGALISLGTITICLKYARNVFFAISGLGDSYYQATRTQLIQGILGAISVFAVYEGIQLLAVFITSKIIQKNKITS